MHLKLAKIENFMLFVFYHNCIHICMCTCMYVQAHVYKIYRLCSPVMTVLQLLVTTTWSPERKWMDTFKRSGAYHTSKNKHVFLYISSVAFLPSELQTPFCINTVSSAYHRHSIFHARQVWSWLEQGCLGCMLLISPNFNNIILK